MTLTTLMLLVKDDKILLGEKKRGFGAGRLNGAGGKVEPGETIEDAAKRETYEEIGVRVNSMKKVATIVFDDLYYKGVPGRNIMFVYASDDFDGEPIETDEIKPEWFNVSDLPYDKMWIDDKVWMPEILKGNSLEAYFLFNEDNIYTDYWIEIDPKEHILDFSDESLSVQPEPGSVAAKPYRQTARAVLIDDNNHILLGHNVNVGNYETIGGGIHLGELRLEGLKREVLEETGYDFEVLDFICKTTEHRNRVGLTQDSFTYLCRAKAQVTKPNYTEKELASGQRNVWCDNIDDAISKVEAPVKNLSYSKQFMQARDAAILRKAKDIIESKYAK